MRSLVISGIVTLLLVPPAAAQLEADPVPNVYAVDDLVPEANVFDGTMLYSSGRPQDLEYATKAFVVGRYEELFSYAAAANLRMVVTPTAGALGEKEFAVGFRLTGEGTDHPAFGVTVLEAPEPAWTNDELRRETEYLTDPQNNLTPDERRRSKGLLATLKARVDAAEAAGLARCETQLDQKRGTRLYAAWREMLLRTRYFRPRDADMRPNDGAGLPGVYHFSGNTDGPAAGQAEYPLPGTKARMLAEAVIALRDYCKSKDDKFLAELDRQLTTLEHRLKTTR